MKISLAQMQKAEALQRKINEADVAKQAAPKLAGFRLVPFYHPPSAEDPREATPPSFEVEVEAGSPSFKAVSKCYFAEMKREIDEAKAEADEMGVEL